MSVWQFATIAARTKIKGVYFAAAKFQIESKCLTDTKSLGENPTL